MPDASLDMLLGDLQDQLKAPIDTSSPAVHGSCAACQRPILGEVISALGQRYHPEHFVCANCQLPLGTGSFYEQDGVPNCERCYQELLCPRCAHCDEPILDRCVTALGKKWHMDHFICTQCLSPFHNGVFDVMQMPLIMIQVPFSKGILDHSVRIASHQPLPHVVVGATSLFVVSV